MQTTAWLASNGRMICRILHDEMTQIILCFIINIIVTTIISSRNSVRVVSLIARGWRGTSLPRGNVSMGIQRHRCWAFSVKSHLRWTLLWRITPKKHNTYGVVPHTTYPNPGQPALSFGNPGLSKAQHLRRWNVHFITWLMSIYTWINGNLLRKSATPTALFPTHYMLTQGSPHYRLATLDYQKRNTDGVETFIS